jgi:hypothetical protein
MALECLVIMQRISQEGATPEPAAFTAEFLSAAENLQRAGLGLMQPLQSYFSQEGRERVQSILPVSCALLISLLRVQGMLTLVEKGHREAGSSAAGGHQIAPAKSHPLYQEDVLEKLDSYLCSHRLLDYPPLMLTWGVLALEVWEEREAADPNSNYAAEKRAVLTYITRACHNNAFAHIIRYCEEFNRPTIGAYGGRADAAPTNPNVGYLLENLRDALYLLLLSSVWPSLRENEAAWAATNATFEKLMGSSSDLALQFWLHDLQQPACPCVFQDALAVFPAEPVPLLRQLAALTPSGRCAWKTAQLACAFLHRLNTLCVRLSDHPHMAYTAVPSTHAHAHAHAHAHGHSSSSSWVMLTQPYCLPEGIVLAAGSVGRLVARDLCQWSVTYSGLRWLLAAVAPLVGASSSSSSSSSNSSVGGGGGGGLVPDADRGEFLDAALRLLRQLAEFEDVCAVLDPAVFEQERQLAADDADDADNAENADDSQQGGEGEPTLAQLCEAHSCAALFAAPGDQKQQQQQQQAHFVPEHFVPEHLLRGRDAAAPPSLVSLALKICLDAGLGSSSAAAPLQTELAVSLLHVAARRSPARLLDLLDAAQPQRHPALPVTQALCAACARIIDRGAAAGAYAGVVQVVGVLAALVEVLARRVGRSEERAMAALVEVLVRSVAARLDGWQFSHRLDKVAVLAALLQALLGVFRARAYRGIKRYTAHGVLRLLVDFFVVSCASPLPESAGINRLLLELLDAVLRVRCDDGDDGDDGRGGGGAGGGGGVGGGASFALTLLSAGQGVVARGCVAVVEQYADQTADVHPLELRESAFFALRVLTVFSRPDEATGEVHSLAGYLGAATAVVQEACTTILSRFHEDAGVRCGVLDLLAAIFDHQAVLSDTFALSQTLIDDLYRAVITDQPAVLLRSLRAIEALWQVRPSTVKGMCQVSC